VKLREHPLLKYRRVCNWPPVWTQHTNTGVKTLTGEIGILLYVHARHQPSNKCFLVIEHGREKFVGTLIFDDEAFCGQISAFAPRPHRPPNQRHRRS
jgi:hypothetical protein